MSRRTSVSSTSTMNSDPTYEPHISPLDISSASVDLQQAPTHERKRSKKCGPRSKGGCYTCRLRGKKCDGQRDAGTNCQNCVRLRIECLGWGTKLPRWIKLNKLAIKKMITAFTRKKGRREDGPFVESSIAEIDDNEWPSFLHISSSFDSDSSQDHHLSLIPTSVRDTQYSLPRLECADSSTSWTMPPVPLLHPIPPPSLPSVKDPRSQYIQCLRWVFLLSDRDLRQTWQEAIDLNPYHNTPLFNPLNILPLIQLMKADGWNSNILEDGRIIAQLSDCLKFIQQERQASGIVFPRSFKSIAIASLTVVSVLLWAGGYDMMQGVTLDCTTWIDILVAYAYQSLGFQQGWNNDVNAAFLSLPKDQQIIIRTTIWFDVWSSITFDRSPLLMPLIDDLWGPNQLFVDQTLLYAPCARSSSCMKDINGGTEIANWAIGKTSLLREMYLSNKIGNYDLVQECSAILGRLSQDRCIIGEGPPVQIVDESDLLHVARQRAALVLNATAQLYAWSVMEKDKRSSPYIRNMVELTKQSLLVATNKLDLPVIRTLYFSVFLCGALTSKVEDRVSMQNILEEQCSSRDRFGNAGSVLQVLKKVWERSPLDDLNIEVPWKKLLKDSRALLI